MDQPNRRNHTRYPGEHLRVLVRSRENNSRDWIKGFISSVDFSRYGIGLETNHCFSIGEQVSMVIRTDDASISEVNGVVCNRHKLKLGFRCGIQFQLNDGNKELAQVEQQAATSTFH